MLGVLIAEVLPLLVPLGGQRENTHTPACMHIHTLLHLYFLWCICVYVSTSSHQYYQLLSQTQNSV